MEHAIITCSPPICFTHLQCDLSPLQQIRESKTRQLLSWFSGVRCRNWDAIGKIPDTYSCIWNSNDMIDRAP